MRWGILRFTEQDAAKPASELAFPSVTVCSPGLNMEAVEEALYQDFEEWKRENGRDMANVHGQDIDLFMEAEYAMKVGKGNIFDTIRALVLPPTSLESPSSSAALLNQATCTREEKSSKSNRPKRATATGDIFLALKNLNSIFLRVSINEKAQYNVEYWTSASPQCRDVECHKLGRVRQTLF